MLPNKKKAICFGLVVILGALSLSGCASTAARADAKGGDIVKPVKALATESEAYMTSLNYKGYVTAKDIKKLSFEISGKVKTVYVEKGQRIQAGDALAEMDTTNIQLAADNAKQDILLAKNSIAQIQNGIGKISLGIDTERLNLNKVQIGIEAEELNLKKIEDSYEKGISSINLSYDHVKETYDKMEVLYNSGAVSKQNYDDAKYAFDSVVEELEKTKQSRDNDISLQQKNIENMKNNMELQKVNIKSMENELQSAYTQIDAAELKVNQANIGLELYDKQLNDSKLIAPVSGYVVDIPVKAGEITGAGYPVVVMKSSEQVVSIGIPVEDYDKIEMGMQVFMESAGTEFTGVVSMIALYPDEGTRTYNVEITPDNVDLAMSSIVDVQIPIETNEGIFVPINSVISADGIDYLYCLEETEGDGTYKAVKTEVILGDVQGEKVLVKNIISDLIIISDGVKDIKENDKVIIVE